jgi:hypothetical protein
VSRDCGESHADLPDDLRVGLGGRAGLTGEQLGRISVITFAGLVGGILFTGPLADRRGGKLFESCAQNGASILEKSKSHASMLLQPGQCPPVGTLLCDDLFALPIGRQFGMASCERIGSKPRSMSTEELTDESCKSHGSWVGYRLNILGIRVSKKECQLVARSGSTWETIGAGRSLPVQIPQNVEQLKDAATDSLRMTAQQYVTSQNESDLREVLSQEKESKPLCAIALTCSCHDAILDDFAQYAATPGSSVSDVAPQQSCRPLVGCEPTSFRGPPLGAC